MPASVVYGFVELILNKLLQHLFNGPLSNTTRMSRYQKGKTRKVTSPDLLEQQWQWHQLGHMQICTSPQTDNHASVEG